MSPLEHKSFKSMNTTQEKPQNSNDDLRSLIELGCIIDSISIGGKTFELKTMNAFERMQLVGTLSDDVTSEEMFDFNNRLLASVVKSVNGKSLECLHPQYDPQAEDDIKFRLKVGIIEKMHVPVINKLLDFHEELMKRSETQFETEQVKN